MLLHSLQHNDWMEDTNDSYIFCVIKFYNYNLILFNTKMSAVTFN